MFTQSGLPQPRQVNSTDGSTTSCVVGHFLGLQFPLMAALRAFQTVLVDFAARAAIRPGRTEIQVELSAVVRLVAAVWTGVFRHQNGHSESSGIGSGSARLNRVRSDKYGLPLVCEVFTTGRTYSPS